MSYLINKIDKKGLKGLAEFLLNPYLKAAELGDMILQRPSKNARDFSHGMNCESVGHIPI